MSEPKLLDHDVLDELVATIGITAAQAVIVLFRDEGRDFVAIIRRGAAAADDAAAREMARRAAHSLKSSAGQLGAAGLAAAARRVEEIATLPDAALAAEAAALCRVAEETERALDEWLGRDRERG